MGPFEMVVCIVLIGAVVSVIKMRSGITKDASGNEVRAAHASETKELLTEIRTLKERIQVLERIATENNRALTLDAEIDKLRDGAPQ
jgi:uncharacterized protein with von Willebrand factor type A (vWA) domain